MYRIVFYKSQSGNEPVKESLEELIRRGKSDKDSRIRIEKIQDYIKVLQEKGMVLGEPYVKYMGGDIWELRPLRERIFFFIWRGKIMVLLHHYYKRSRKTPRRELVTAQKRMKDFRERMDAYEQKEN